jgi:hypothetical protein
MGFELPAQVRIRTPGPDGDLNPRPGYDRVMLIHIILWFLAAAACGWAREKKTAGRAS